MRYRWMSVVVLVIAAAHATLAEDDVPPGNWAAPPYWTPVAAPREASESAGAQKSFRIEPEAVTAVASAPLPFVAITPCRVADTRGGSGFPSGYGPPSIGGGVSRDFTVAGQCAIPADAQAVSFNFTVWNTTSYGDFKIYPKGAAVSPVSTLNWGPGTLMLANAAVVPLGAGGGITVVNEGAGTVDLFFDVNGYYSPLGVVNSVNTLSGAVTLGAGTNVTITPAGQTLTIAAAGASLPAGVANQTLRHNGSSWTANGALTSDGSNVAIGGILDLPMPTSVTASTERLLTVDMNYNLFLGRSSGASISTGYQNTALGYNALTAASSAHDNTAVGWQAMGSTDGGLLNTAVGSGALSMNSSGSLNVAVGANALHSATSDENTAVGSFALNQNQSGYRNTAVGASSLWQNTSGSLNTAVGHSALVMSTGDQNTAVGWNSAGNTKSGQENTAVGSGALNNNEFGSGNVAIGQVAGHDVLGSNNVLIGLAAGYSETGSNRLYIANWSTAPALIYGQFDNGRVGINNQSLSNAALDVAPKISGDVAIRGYSAAGTGVYGKSAAAGYSGVFGTNDSSGYGVYGLSVSGYSVYCNGNGGYTGSWGLISDGRLKRDVEPLEDGLSRVMALRGVRFLYRVEEFPEKKLPHEPQVGFIAQEVEEIVPSVVVTGPDGYKSVDYAKLTPLLVEAVKAQQNEIRDLKAQVRSLEVLRARMERLEASLPEVR